MKDKIYTEEDVQLLELLHEDRKNTNIYFDLEPIVKARIVLLTWLKGIQSRDINKDKKQALTNDLNIFGKVLDSHTVLEEKNFTFQRKIIHLEKKVEKVEESKLRKENILLKEMLLNLSEQVDNYEKLLEAKGIIKTSEITKMETKINQ